MLHKRAIDIFTDRREINSGVIIIINAAPLASLLT